MKLGIIFFSMISNQLLADEYVECPIQGLVPNNGAYYSIFEIDGIPHALKANRNFINQLPVNYMSRFLFSVAQYEGGYFWAGYGDDIGLYFHNEQQGKDTLIKKGDFVSVFKSLDGDVFAIKNIVNSEDTRVEYSLLYQYSNLTKEWNVLKEFPGRVANVISRMAILNGVSSNEMADDVQYISGLNGWAYEFSSGKKESGYLSCVNVKKDKPAVYMDRHDKSNLDS